MPTFATLWSKHPSVIGEKPLLDTKVYENQCAINLSAAFLRSGVDMRTYRGQWSWQEGKPRYAIRAQELAEWLVLSSGRIHTTVEKMPGRQAFGGIEGKLGIANRTGIVFFQNYWGVGAQGDHIDLWNGSRLTALRSWFQIYARIGSLGLGTDYRNAQSVWFFPVS